MVEKGVLIKGMPAWGRVLKPNELMTVVAYLGTLRNTNVAGGKAPQGTDVSAAAQAAPTP